MSINRFRNQAFVTGITTIAILSAAIYGFFWLKGFQLKPAYSFYAQFLNPQKIPLGSAVVFRGVQIGTIGEIKLSPALDSTFIRIDIKDPKIILPNNLLASIKDENLMGLKMLELKLSADEADHNIKAGELIIGEDVVGLIQIEEQILTLLERINDKVANETVTEEAGFALKKINCMSEKLDHMLSQERPAFKMFFGNPTKDFKCRI